MISPSLADSDGRRSPFVIQAMLVLVAAGACIDETSTPTPSRTLAVVPDAIEFPVTATGGTSVVRVTIESTGSEGVIIEGQPWLAEHEGEGAFSVRDVMFDCDAEAPTEIEDGYVLRPGDCRALEVVFSPDAPGVHRGELHIESNADEDGERGGVRSITVEGTSQPPTKRICLLASECVAHEVCRPSADDETLTLSFPLTASKESRSCPIRFENPGEVPITLAGWGFTEGNRFGDFSLDPPEPSSSVLEPGEAMVVQVTFHPASGGERAGTITLSSDDYAVANAEIEIRGVGGAPGVCVEPMPVAQFGAVEVGESEKRTITLSSCGTQPLELWDAWVTEPTGRDDSPDFRLTGEFVADLVEPGHQMEVEVVLSPSVVGMVNGRLYFKTNDPTVPQGFVSLAGEGISPPSCDLRPMVWERLFFGAVAEGHPPAVRSLSVTNVGAAPCSSLQGFVSDGEDAGFVLVSAEHAPQHLGAGETAVFELGFAPSAQEPVHEGAFSITTPDMETDLAIPLLAVSSAEPACNLVVDTLCAELEAAKECRIPFGVPGIGFGGVSMGDGATSSVFLENTGSADCVIQATTLLGHGTWPADSAFELAGASARVSVAGVETDTIAPGERGELIVHFEPHESHAFCGALRVESNDPSAGNCAPGEVNAALVPVGSGVPGCLDVPLSGMGVRGRSFALPAGLDIGVIETGCGSPEAEVSLWATGKGPVTVGEPVLAPANAPFRLVEPVPASGTIIEPGDKLTYRVRLDASAEPGEHTAALTLESDALESTETVTIVAQAVSQGRQRDVFRQVVDPLLDVLWVVDDSSAMVSLQENLAKNIETYAQRTIRQETDFRLGVITTDWADPGRAGRLIGDPTFVTREHPDVLGAMRDRASVGFGGHHVARPLETMAMALTEPLSSGHNSGFLRDDAMLRVLIVGASEDQSEGPIDFYVDLLRHLKGDRVTVDAVVGDPGVDGHAAGCETEHGAALPASRVYQLGTTLGGRFYSVCSPDWGKMADEIGLDTWWGRRGFSLSREPVPQTIQVRVNEQLIPKAGGWKYDADKNSIEFSAASTPDVGARIDVWYETVCRGS